MDSSYLIWALKPQTNAHASVYYRLEVPLRMFKDAEKAEVFLDDMVDTEHTAKMMIGSDFDLFYSSVGDVMVNQIKEIKELKCLQKPDGTYFIPPSVIYDCDDNHDFVHPFSSTFCTSGVRNYPDGKFLTKGDTLFFDDDAGVRRILWEDGETKHKGQTFNIERNFNLMATRHKIMRMADGVTVTVPSLASYVKEVIGVSNVYVFPNTIIPKDYISYPLMPRTDNKIRILWQGGSSHFIDWYPLRDAIRQVVKKYPQVTIVLFGEIFDWIADVIPEEQLEIISWVDYSAYKLRRGLLQVDINLCPLANNPFNSCKSAIKWYEGEVWDKPEATLAANVKPYSDEMEDNVTGLLYNTKEEFVEKLSILIENEQLRKRLGHAAKQWVLKNRTPEATFPGLFDFYIDCRARKQREILTR